MSVKKPTPTLESRDAKLCIVCGKRSYSRNGIHPQCAVRQAEAPRTLRLKAERKLQAKKGTATKSPARTTWTKKHCPKCGAELHVRKKNCSCGFHFPGS